MVRNPTGRRGASGSTGAPRTTRLFGPRLLAEEGGESGRVGGGDGGARDKGGCGADVGLVGATVGGQLGVAGAARQAEIARQYAAYGNASRRSLRRGSQRRSGLAAGALRRSQDSLSPPPWRKSKSSLDPQLGAPQGNGVLGATMAARSVWGGSMIVHRRPPPRMSPSRSSLPMASASSPTWPSGEQQAAERRLARTGLTDGIRVGSMHGHFLSCGSSAQE